MDVVGGAASICAILEAAKTICDFLKWLYNANEDRLKLMRELYSCTRAFEGVCIFAKENAEKLHNLNALLASGSLEQYKTVDHLASRVVKAKNLKDVAKKFQFVIGRTTMQELLFELERHKNTLQMCLGADNLQIILSVDAKLNTLSLGLDQRVVSTDTWSSPGKKVGLANAPFKVPFGRHADDFINREEYMIQIANGLKKHNRIAVYGLGGTGKSRLAIEYLYRLRELEPLTAIYWVYAAGEEHFRNSHLSIAEAVPREFRQQFEEMRKSLLSELKDAHMDVQELVRSWLQSETSGPWLVVLDNADNPDGFLQSGDSTKFLRKYIPQSANGHTLITSRPKDVAISLVGGEASLIHLGNLAAEESVELFRKLLPYQPASDGQILKLAQALDRLPLVIKQAAAYITSLSILIEDE